jgi:hypothetical protein
MAGMSMDLQAFLRGSGIKHFSAREICPVGRKAGPVTLKLAPPTIWGNILPTLRVLEELRGHFGKPVVVLSGYRSPAYNEAVHGERASLHLSFNAIDFRCGMVTPLVLATWLDAHPDAAKFGIGLYGSFVHLDTRGMLGRPAPARWAGDGRIWWEQEGEAA